MKVRILLIVAPVLLTGCNKEGEFVLNFANQEKSIVLEGSHLESLCTPVFKNHEEEEQAWGESESFDSKYCPDVHVPESDVRHFSYYTDTGTFQEWNPGGYEEMGLYSDADLQRIEREQTQEPYTEDGLTLWVSCEKGERDLNGGLKAQTLKCTNYRSESPEETYSTLPNTDCFIPVADNLYFGFRIPVAEMDAAIDGCDQLQEWGIQSIRLK